MGTPKKLVHNHLHRCLRAGWFMILIHLEDDIEGTSSHRRHHHGRHWFLRGSESKNGD